MKLHELSSIRKKAKRVGRGGKRGTTAGRGTKGQKSRSGHSLRPAQRDLILRIPKRRGFRNKTKSSDAAVFNVGTLSERLKTSGHEKGVTVSRDFLVEAGLLQARFKGPVKLLGHGDVTLPFNVKGLKVSKEAAQKIEQAGGTIGA